MELRCHTHDSIREPHDIGLAIETVRLYPRATQVCVPSYLLASNALAVGMSWWQAVACIVVANFIVLIPLILNGHAGTKYGVPFPVLARASFGVRGAHVPVRARTLWHTRASRCT